MFSEVAFADDDEPTLRSSAREKRHRSDADSLRSRESANAVRGGVYRFHRPGDADFSPVAATSAASRYRESFACGDLWASAVCHCLRCDLVRSMGQLQALRRPSVRSGAVAASSSLLTGVDTSVPTLVLLDLDNFGFPQFKSRSVPRGSVEAANVFVWAFYGACFSRHFQTTPEEFLRRPAATASTGTDDGGPTNGSLWHTLHTTGRLALTPCGGHSQAVDEAMVAVASALDGAVWTVFVSGDAHLGETAAGLLGTHGAVVNPRTMGRRLDAVWDAVVASREREDEQPTPPVSGPTARRASGAAPTARGERRAEAPRGSTSSRKRAREAAT